MLCLLIFVELLCFILLYLFSVFYVEVCSEILSLQGTNLEIHNLRVKWDSLKIFVSPLETSGRPGFDIERPVED